MYLRRKKPRAARRRPEAAGIQVQIEESEHIVLDIAMLNTLREDAADTVVPVGAKDVINVEERLRDIVRRRETQ